MYLLDTSAILAHCYAEPAAAEIVGEILANRTGYVAAVTWFELRVKLQFEVNGSGILDLYSNAVAGTVDITEEIADAAFRLRQAAKTRIPTVDSLIAGAALARGYQLVHRDDHLAAIPTSLLPQKLLPPKS